MPWSYSGDPSTSDLDAVRFEIQDTNSSAPLLEDTEVLWALLDENKVAGASPTTVSGPTLYGPAARCCAVIARNFLAQADSQIGQLRIVSTKRAAQYEDMARQLRLKAQGYYAPYAGGQSISEKEEFAADSDAVLPAFTRTEFDSPYTGQQNGFLNEDFGPPVE